MSNVSYKQDEFKKSYRGKEDSAMSLWVQEHSGGLIDTPAKAQIFYLGVAIVLFFIALSIVSGNSSKVDDLSTAEAKALAEDLLYSESLNPKDRAKFEEWLNSAPE